MYIHSTVVTNWQEPGAESPGSKLPATPAPPAPVTDTSAPKNPNPDHASQPRPVSVQSGCPPKQAMNCICGTSRCETHCNCGEPQFSAPKDQAPVVEQQRHVNNLVQENARNLNGILNSCNCGRRLSPPRLHLRICATRTSGTSGTSTTKCEQQR